MSSAGFWPGSAGVEYPAFYSYAYPEPPGFSSAPIRPARAFSSRDLSEYILPYDAVRTANDPEQALMDFLTGTYKLPPIWGNGTGPHSNFLSGSRESLETSNTVHGRKATRRICPAASANSPAQLVLALRCSFRPSLICSRAASVEGTLRSAFSATKSWIVPL